MEGGENSTCGLVEEKEVVESRLDDFFDRHLKGDTVEAFAEASELIWEDFSERYVLLAFALALLG